jgi:hypothetical protein
MTLSGKGQGKVSTLAGPSAKYTKLPYRIELRDTQKKDVERVLGRAVSAPLARAIYSAALDEHPERRITLCRGARVIAQRD